MTEPTQTTVQTPAVTVTVIGEALIDMVQFGAPGEYRARPGGSPFNVAVGLARLGHRTALMARLAENTFGRMLRAHAAAEGIDLTVSPHAAEPTTLALVSMDTEGRADYDFYFDGTGQRAHPRRRRTAARPRHGADQLRPQRPPRPAGRLRTRQAGRRAGCRRRAPGQGQP
jgi:hypothetical protein